MIKINRSLFDLDEVYKNLNIALTLSILENLIECRKPLFDGRIFLLENGNKFGENINDIVLLTEQIVILDKNIKVLQEALLCHESKVLEKRITLKDLQVICLN